jgi:hypothetical protein
MSFKKKEKVRKRESDSMATLIHWRAAGKFMCLLEKFSASAWQ